MKGFRELVQLHLANEADRKAGRKQADLLKRIAALEEDVAAAKVRLELADSELKRLHAERKAAEHEVQRLDDQRTKYRSQLMTAKTNEIYKTLISEIETAARAISERETVVLGVMEALDPANRALDEAKMDLAKVESVRAAEERTLRAGIEALEAERAAARKRAAELEPQVDPPLLTQYKRIQAAREGKGMTLALGHACTECHMSIRPQEWVELINPERVSTCIGCKRILYREESASGSAA